MFSDIRFWLLSYHGGDFGMYDTIRMWCNDCDWIEVNGKKVHIALNLQDNTIEYIAICPYCGKETVMVRKYNG